MTHYFAQMCSANSCAKVQKWLRLPPLKRTRFLFKFHGTKQNIGGVGNVSNCAHKVVRLTCFNWSHSPLRMLIRVLHVSSLVCKNIIFPFTFLLSMTKV